jgi:DNA-binding CsgD family transcriptional regulator
MSKSVAKHRLTLTQRKAIFHALVEAQDAGLGAIESRKAIANKMGISEMTVRLIENEGIAADWPPL